MGQRYITITNRIDKAKNTLEVLPQDGTVLEIEVGGRIPAKTFNLSYKKELVVFPKSIR